MRELLPQGPGGAEAVLEEATAKAQLKTSRDKVVDTDPPRRKTGTAQTTTLLGNQPVNTLLPRVRTIVVNPSANTPTMADLFLLNQQDSILLIPRDL